MDIFGVHDFGCLEAAEARASAKEETRASKREAAPRKTAPRKTAPKLGEFRQALGAKLAAKGQAKQAQADDRPRIVGGLSFGQRRARLQALMSRPAPAPVPASTVVEVLPSPTRENASFGASPKTCKDAAPLPPSSCQPVRRSVAFCEEAQAEYEAHLAE